MKQQEALAFTRTCWTLSKKIKAKASTLYKCKADKVHPVNYSGPSGDMPGGLKLS